jgi:tetratricopeptide (TPR) repeat protein
VAKLQRINRNSSALTQWCVGLVTCCSLAVVDAQTEFGSRLIMVDGLAVDSLGLQQKSGLELFTSLTDPASELPEFSLTQPLFLHAEEEEEKNTDGYFPVLGRNLVGEEVEEVDWYKAYTRAKEQVSISPDNMESVKGVALLAAVMKQYDQADKYFRIYIKNRPDEIPYQAAWAYVLIFRENFDGAERVSRSILNHDPDNVSAHFTLLCAQYGAKSEKFDRSYWNTAGGLQKVQVAQWLRGDEKELQRALGESSIERIAAITLGRKSSSNLELIASNLERAEHAFARQNYKQALVYYDAAKRFGVESVTIFQNMAMCYFELGQVQDALAIMSQLTTIMGDASDKTWFGYGYILLDQKLYKKAGEAFDEALKRAPENPRNRFARAAAFAGNGQLDMAWPILAKLAKEPDVDLKDWLDSTRPYAVAIKSDPRFASLF